jgi:DNA-binding response OmpR family regulator
MQSDASALAPLEIVAIDDHEDTLTMISTFLEAEGHRVRPFDRAEPALLAIRARKPDLVLVDLALPDTNGARLAMRLRADPALAELPLVAMTACVDPEWDVVRHFDAYLRKPIDLEILGDLARTLVANVRAASHRRAS